VLERIDLSGRLAICTGGYSGLGLETVRALTDAEARVAVPARRRAHAQQVLAGAEGVEVDELDLGDLDSVHAFSERRWRGSAGSTARTATSPTCVHSVGRGT
jgi:NAD(P)-dependent dehydrogenase (short-subunit alcohol dehydrogenase family)